jgi:hypothetical protein
MQNAHRLFDHCNRKAPQVGRLGLGIEAYGESLIRLWFVC